MNTQDAKRVLETALICAQQPLALRELRTLFNQTGTAGELEIYPYVHHGFAFPERWCYDKPAAERHWERLHALYRRRL